MIITIYTDGSCSKNPGPGGWGAIINFDNKVKQISGGNPETTNNQMELQAVIEALDYVIKLTNNCSKKEQIHIQIYSDSAYVINAINQGWLYRWRLMNWKTVKGDDVKNKTLWQSLYLHIAKIKVNGYELVFRKVKGHSGNPLNEAVDKLAKEQVFKIIGGN